MKVRTQNLFLVHLMVITGFVSHAVKFQIFK